MVFTSKYVGTVPSSYEKRIYRPAVSQRLRNTGLFLSTVNEMFYQYVSVCYVQACTAAVLV
jgi:hypothetical protein